MGRPSMTDQKLVSFPTGTLMRDLYIEGAGQLLMYMTVAVQKRDERLKAGLH